MRFLLLVIVLAATSPALGRFVAVEVEQVPVARLIENLEKITSDNPASAEAWLNLGRAHGMAYARKTDPLAVPKTYHGMTPPAVPFAAVTPALDAALRAASQAHLEAALKAYKQALELDQDNLVIQLGLAWLTEQAGNKDDAVKQYRKIAAAAWEKDKKQTMIGLGGYTLTGEIASYLVPLLNVRWDRHEIATLQDRVATLRKLPYLVTPIVVPLADGLSPADLEAPGARVTFDVDGSGLGHEWSWITAKAAWLVSDPAGDGRITSGRQLFGNVTFWMFWSNGYAPLAALDDDRNGVLSGNELAGLALWHDANGNGVADPGEVKPLSAYGIVALSCAWQTFDGSADNIAFSPNGVVFHDGKTRPSFDLVLKAQPSVHVTHRAETRTVVVP
ncbi:hypothetical protein [Bradyrhizobium sp. HKCCYLS20291]|uniref:hypothetical protein n=1 Tax=Bradyrhizobium sp. HKCCYLS20291 TaxID=3420766 RepID=UPI003EBCF8F5